MARQSGGQPGPVSEAWRSSPDWRNRERYASRIANNILEEV
jgi:hypothetical protein